MRISTFGYVGKQGVKNIWRNKMFSLASIATMSACIFLFGLFFSILVNFQYIIKSAEEGVAITVFFNDDATEDRSTYDNLLRLCRDDPDVYEPLKFLREREVVHFQRFGEAMSIIQSKLDSKNFYAYNPEFKK